MLAVLLAAAIAVPAILLTGGGEELSVGDDWSRVPHVESVFGAGQTHVQARALVANDDRMVAVGNDGILDGVSENNGAAWWSPDGVTWRHASIERPAGPGGEYITGVASGPDGFVAVGTAGTVGRLYGYEGPLDLHAAVWTSPDGSAWTRVPHDPEVFGEPSAEDRFDLRSIQGVTRGGPGFVAVGFDTGSESEPYGAAVWTSADGRSWSRVPRDREVFGSRFEPGGAEMMRVAADTVGQRLVAVGVDLHLEGEQTAAAVWFSVDGLSWTRVPHDDAVFGGPASYFQMDDVVAGSPGFVAVGAEAFPEGEFRRLPFTDGVLVTPTGFQDAPVRGAVWTSPDGLVWKRVPTEQLPGRADENVRLIGVAAGGPGLVAVGWRGQPEDRDAVVWTSPDGETWSLASDLGGALRSPGGQAMLDVIAGGPGLVAVGADGSAAGFSAGVWMSPGRPAAETTVASEVFDLQATVDSFVRGGPGGSLRSRSAMVLRRRLRRVSQTPRVTRFSPTPHSGCQTRSRGRWSCNSSTRA